MLSSLDACLGRLPRPLQGRLLARLLLARPQVQRAGHAAYGMAPPRHSGGAGQAAGLRQFAAHASAAVAEPGAAEDFYAAESVTFSGLGLREEVCAALQAAGYPRPAHAQELAVPRMLAGNDVVLAAETGSGKTLAYLAPLVDWALRSRAAAAARAAADAATAEAAAAQGEAPAHERRRRHATATLVLCPNAALCEQVAAAVGALRDPASGAPLAATALVSSQSPPPQLLPDIVVTTPGALVSLLDGGGQSYGYEWTREGLPGWARCVVFDEADLLLSGSYGAQMNILWDALRGGDRLHAARRMCMQTGLTEDEFAELPYHLRRAALRDGMEGLLAAGFKPRRDAAAASGGQEAAEREADDAAWPPGVRGPSWRRQYVFVAATMPAEGEHTVGAEIAARFPAAAWLAGRQLHQSKRAVEHAWRRVEDDAHRAEVLRDLVANDEQLAAGTGRMLVFALDIASANATADALAAAHSGVPVLRYHKQVPAAERAAALERLGSEGGVVMVCTDAAARGLDVADITHVVQADFAQSAVDFLHRVGRTARAGKAGRVTSLFSPDVEPLVQAIQAAIDAGVPVEGAFSRKRSFRKKLRKYGEYVPRGEEGPVAPREERAAARQDRQLIRRQLHGGDEGSEDEEGGAAPWRREGGRRAGGDWQLDDASRERRSEWQRNRSYLDRPGFGESECFNCGEMGHFARECPNGAGGGGSGERRQLIKLPLLSSRAGGEGSEGQEGDGAPWGGMPEAGERQLDDASPEPRSEGARSEWQRDAGSRDRRRDDGSDWSRDRRGGDRPGFGESPCYNCGEIGHFARECPNVGGGGGERRRDGGRSGMSRDRGGGDRYGDRPGFGESPCYNCGEIGHFARECPNVGGGGGSERRRDGGRSGMSRDRGGGDRYGDRPGFGESPCYNCGEIGHFARECPNVGGGGGGERRRDGGRSGMSRDRGGGDRYGDRPGFGESPCYNCGEIGHFARECPNIGGGGGGERRRDGGRSGMSRDHGGGDRYGDRPGFGESKCFNCGEIGHFARECPNIGGGGGGGERRRDGGGSGWYGGSGGGSEGRRDDGGGSGGGGGGGGADLDWWE